eukprot:jgi/Botrbrau1/2262/Bobra.101_2s0086.1
MIHFLACRSRPRLFLPSALTAMSTRMGELRTANSASSQAGGACPSSVALSPSPTPESTFVDSVIGCTSYVGVAWVWAIIFYMGLDPLKWLMAYILDEEGLRTGTKEHMKAFLKRVPTRRRMKEQAVAYAAAPTANNPLGRASMTHPFSEEQLRRASVVRMTQDGTMTAEPIPAEPQPHTMFSVGDLESGLPSSLATKTGFFSKLGRKK